MDRFFKVQVIISIPDYYSDDDPNADAFRLSVSPMDFLTVHPEANLHDIEESEMVLHDGQPFVCIDCVEEMNDSINTTNEEGQQ